MGLGIVSDEEFESSLQDIKKPTSIPVIIEMDNKGRKDGDVNVPNSIRAIIGDTANIDGRKEALALASSLGISDSSVSAYTNGVNSTKEYNGAKNPAIVELLTKSKNKIARKASKVAKAAIEKIDDDSLGECSAVELAQVAKHMASIIPMMEPPPEQSKDNRPQIIQFFAPAMRDESKFETIIVKDN